MKIMPDLDLGNVQDNERAFLVAVSYINAGNVEWGEHILLELRDFIRQTGETKSTHWILPKVLDVLKWLDVRQSVAS